MLGLKIISEQQIWLKWDHYLLFNRGVKYLLCVIDAFPKYPQVKPLKDKKVNELVIESKKI